MICFCQSRSERELCQSPEELAQILEWVNSENLGVTLDFSHIHIQSLSPRQFIESTKHKLFNVHISDATGTKDHLPLGLGIVNLEEIFELLGKEGYDGTCVLEGFYVQDPMKGLEYSKRTFLKILKRSKPSWQM